MIIRRPFIVLALLLAAFTTPAFSQSASLANPVWSPLETNTLSNGSHYFSDPQWTNYPVRFYRLHSQ